MKRRSLVRIPSSPSCVDMSKKIKLPDYNCVPPIFIIHNEIVKWTKHTNDTNGAIGLNWVWNVAKKMCNPLNKKITSVNHHGFLFYFIYFFSHQSHSWRLSKPNLSPYWTAIRLELWASKRNLSWPIITELSIV